MVNVDVLVMNVFKNIFISLPNYLHLSVGKVLYFNYDLLSHNYVIKRKFCDLASEIYIQFLNEINVLTTIKWKSIFVSLICLSIRNLSLEHKTVHLPVNAVLMTFDVDILWQRINNEDSSICFKVL